jgi:glucose/arabinose dehydrogenase
MDMRKFYYVFIAVFIAQSVAAQTEAELSQIQSEIVPMGIADKDLDYKAELIIPDLNIPWGMDFLPDGSIIFTEKSGELYLFKDGKKTEIKNVPEVYARGQGGLLDIKLHPDYKNNGWLYITYSSSEGEGKGGNTALIRAKLKENKLVTIEKLYKGAINSTRGQHFGSRIVFDKHGYLYFSIGERGNRDENPQDLTRDGGKIYRLNDDGTIPADNPFIGVKNAKTAIYSYGHRNPQGLAIDPITGELWEHEHGPMGGDEINIIKKGKNYGWPIISYGINYNKTSFTELTKKEGMEEPLFYWVPSIAPNGFVIVSSDKYPDWTGNLLVGSLKFQYLERLILKDNKVVKREKLYDNIGRVRNVVQAPDGYIYMAVEGKGIYKLIKK